MGQMLNSAMTSIGGFTVILGKVSPTGIACELRAISSKNNGGTFKRNMITSTKAVQPSIQPKIVNQGLKKSKPFAEPCALIISLNT